MVGSSQISSLLESLPGIADVLRSPVANALVNMIRAGAGLHAFRLDEARELVHYSVRRGLIGEEEAEQLLADVRAAARGRTSSRRSARKVKKFMRRSSARTAKKSTKRKSASKKAPKVKGKKKKTIRKKTRRATAARSKRVSLRRAGRKR